MFKNIYQNKKVIITGHTGFKGSWLTSWLLKLGANVVGISNSIPSKPSMYEVLKLEKKIKNYNVDIRDLDSVKQIFKKVKPDFLFHLAAQPIVSLSYEDPIETITSNVLGTTNILESLRILNNDCTAILITSDKAYDNVEQVWGYKEDDKMGGKDVYSGSKGAAELIIKSYFHSFFKNNHKNIKLGIGRAGNVIGGGDWAKDRIIVDCMKAWSINEKVEIRSPNATRPWQHVLEPLSGYLQLGANLSSNPKLNGFSFNFGPRDDKNKTVAEIINDLMINWKDHSDSIGFKVIDDIPFHEAGLLKLNCDKALFYLKWMATLNYELTIDYTSNWYFNYYNSDINIFDYTTMQINNYEEIALNSKRKWTE